MHPSMCSFLLPNSDGERDEAALRIASAPNLAGYPKDEARRMLLDWNQRNDQTTQLFTDAELLRLMDYIYGRGRYRPENFHEFPGIR